MDKGIPIYTPWKHEGVASPVPTAPKVYFVDRFLLEMATWGTVTCPYTPPQYTVFPGDGQVGRWTLHFDRANLVSPTTDSWETDVAHQLPGMRLHYEDFDSGRKWIWVLTDKIIHNMRLGVWPD